MALHKIYILSNIVELLDKLFLHYDIALPKIPQFS